jgi:signal peptidase I
MQISSLEGKTLNFNMKKRSEEKQERKYTPQQTFFKEARDIIVVLLVFMLIYILCFRMVIVVGSSMYDTLVNGDRLILVSNVLYRNPKAGDIVVASKDSFRDGECIVKRVIATEGQEVDIDFTSGNVYVDGILLEEDYISTPTMLYEGVSFPLIVEEGCIFVMGDNRMDSKDSRSTEIGLIDCREILGKAVFLLFPGKDEISGKLDLSRIGGLF